MSAVLEPALNVLRARAAGEREPRLFILSAPSGAGKDTVLRMLRQRDLDLHVVVTCTTRPRREEERDGVDYHFLSRDDFADLQRRGELLEHAEYAGHSYGTPKQDIRDAFARGEDALLKIEVQGAALVKRQFPGTVMIFLAPPDLAELERRLRDRGVSDPKDMARRLEAAKRELNQIPQYDYLIVNHVNRVAEAADQIEDIIRAERCRLGVPPVRL